MPEETIKCVFPPLDCTAVRRRVMWKSSLFFLFLSSEGRGRYESDLLWRWAQLCGKCRCINNFSFCNFYGALLLLNSFCLGERAREYVHAFRECVPLLLFPKLMSEAHSQEEVRHILPVAHRPENSSSAHLV